MLKAYSLSGTLSFVGRVDGLWTEIIVSPSELLLGRLHVHRALAGQLQLDRLARPLADRVAPADVRRHVDVDLAGVAHVGLRVDHGLPVRVHRQLDGAAV